MTNLGHVNKLQGKEKDLERAQHGGVEENTLSELGGGCDQGQGSRASLTPPLNLVAVHRLASCLWAPVCFWGWIQLSRKAGRGSCQLVVHPAQLSRLEKKACFAR